MAITDDIEYGEWAVIAVVVLIVGYLIYKVLGFLNANVVTPVVQTAEATRQAVQQTGAGQKDPSIPVTGCEWCNWWNEVSGWFHGSSTTTAPVPSTTVPVPVSPTPFNCCSC